MLSSSLNKTFPSLLQPLAVIFEKAEVLKVQLENVFKYYNFVCANIIVFFNVFRCFMMRTRRWCYLDTWSHNIHLDMFCILHSSICMVRAHCNVLLLDILKIKSQLLPNININVK